jgi:hypothetical protein
MEGEGWFGANMRSGHEHLILLSCPLFDIILEIISDPCLKLELHGRKAMRT